MNIHLPCAHRAHQAFDPLLDPENMEGFSHVKWSSDMAETCPAKGKSFEEKHYLIDVFHD